jgi:phosphomannomutase
VLVAHGLDVGRFDEPVPTPLVAGAIRDLGAAAAVVVTASHNPAEDNGLKVYAADGAQLVPPTDTDIAARLDTMAVDDPTTDAAGRVAGVGRTGDVVDLGGPSSGGAVVGRYLERIGELAAGRSPGPSRVAHTSLHGVGDGLLSLALASLTGVEAHPVATQRHPDPDFPTVASPNPEEPSTLAQLLALARQVDADVALALDPDADRLAVALPRRSAGGTTWQQLTGDQVGALLTADLLASTPGGRERLVASTVVSSRLVPAMCRAAGIHHAETLTGFKWLCRPAIAQPELRQLLAYEEALGYAVGPTARDKDGITAAVAVLCALGGWRRRGRSAWDVLDDLARRHGAHVTRNGSLPLDPSRDLAPAMAALAAGPTLGGAEVRSVDHPAPDITRLELAEGTRVVVRPSGTEPKVKYYVEAIEAVGPDGDVPDAETAGAHRADRVVAALTVLLAG